MIWRWFWREWRSPSLLIVWLALTLAMTSVFGLSSLSLRLEQGLNQQGREFLAGDRVLRSSQPVPEAWLDYAQQQELVVSRQISFRTMGYAHDQALLISVKAADQRYPLYGTLETEPPALHPAPGQVLVSPRLLTLLSLQTGDVLEVGDASLTVAGTLIREPDAGFNPFETAPRALINLADIGQTGAIQLGSRLTYRYMFAGSEAAIERYSAFIRPLLEPHQRWSGIEDSGGALGKSLQRAEQFLSLSALLTLLLAFAAVVIAMTHYSRTRYELVAVLKTLGAGRGALTKLVISQWGLLLGLALLVGTGLGLALERGLLSLLHDFLPRKLPAAGWSVWLLSLGVLLLVSILTVVRPYQQLLATPPSRVLRQTVIVDRWPLKYYLPLVGVVLLAVLTYISQGQQMLWLVLAGIVGLVGILAISGWAMLYVLRKVVFHQLAMRLAIVRLLRQPGFTLSQLGTFAFSFMLLALLVMIRGELLERWQTQLPAESPNYFLMNIRTEQLPEIKAFFNQHQLTSQPFYPIALARLVQVNQQPIQTLLQTNSAGAEAVSRELSLTWAPQLPEGNRIIAGTWPPSSGSVSIEQGVAERLGVKIGDQLTFSSGAVMSNATVTSLRYVDWESLRPNFYFIFPAEGLNEFSQMWLTGFRYQGSPQLLTQFSQQFPTVNVLDVDNIVQQITQIIRQVSQVLEVMVVVVLVCGFLLLLAQVNVGMQQRRQELIVYRTLGASKKLLRHTLWAEFALLGGVAGGCAAIGAELALWLLEWQLFEFPWQPNLLLWIVLPLGGSALVSLYGSWLGMRLLRGNRLHQHYGD